MTPLLSLQNVSVRKYDSPVLHQLDWQVLTGQQWVLVGENGAGKTTLLETLAGRWATSQGKLRKEGIVELVAADYSFHRIVKSAAQYYQQRFQSFEAAVAPSVREVLTNQLKPVGTVRADLLTLPPPPCGEEELLRITDLVELTPLLDQPFVTLSNGETRRMLLARSLVKKPNILLLDYPFVGLDTASRAILHHTLGQLAASGTAVILSSSASEIPPSVTHVLELKAGRIQCTLPVADWQQKNTAQQGTEPPKVIDIQALAQWGEPSFSDYSCAFELRNIHIKYDDAPILNGLNWKVNKGEKWALTGPNGSGKSTLLSILTADHPQRFANDYDLFDQKRGGKGVSIWDIKRKIGHVSPELHLYFPTQINVYKAIASGYFDATGVYFQKLSHEQQAGVDLVARLLGIMGLLQQDFHKLSKGEQRLVLLARALVKNPPLLILDEPCQGLDIATTEHFKAVVDAICVSSARTLVYVSHYPNEIPSCIEYHFRLSKGVCEL